MTEGPLPPRCARHLPRRGRQGSSAARLQGRAVRERPLWWGRGTRGRRAAARAAPTRGRENEERRGAWACAGGEILRRCAPQDDISPSRLRRQPPLGKWALRTGRRRAAARAAPTRGTGTTPHPPHGFSRSEKPWGTFSSRRRLGGTPAGGRRAAARAAPTRRTGTLPSRLGRDTSPFRGGGRRAMLGATDSQ